MTRPVVVVPTYNERDNLPPLIDALLYHEDLMVLIVDDGSPDGTGAVADRLAEDAGERVRVLHRQGEPGLGRSYVDGLRTALAMGASHVCQMDADLSHDPNDVPRLLEATRTVDLAIGSRYVPGGALQDWPWHRVALSRAANTYVRLITRLPVHDCTSGFRAWRADLLRRIPLDRIISDGYAFQVELVWEAHTRGSRITEVPITFVERRLGESKLSGEDLFESMLLPWRMVARGRRSRRP